MATRFGKFQTLAQKLITKNGRLVTVQVSSDFPQNPNEPWGPNTANVDIASVPAVFLEYKKSDLNFRNSFGIGGADTLIQMGDKRCLISKLDLPNTQPGTKDRILESDGTEWKIITVNVLQPGNLDETIMFELQVRS
jgi:hypothetical protein